MARHGKPDIFNTDQGSQFTGSTFTERTDKGAGGNATAFCVAIADADLKYATRSCGCTELPPKRAHDVKACARTHRTRAETAELEDGRR
jgi:hypothetical protein